MSISWGARAEDWLENEKQHLPIYREALRRIGIEPGDRVLDAGCGAGVFLELVAARGGIGAGTDAAPELLELARGRAPGADLRSGDLEALPWEDDSFDLVTGFTSFFLADDFVAALREAGRVARPGGTVFAQVWGAPERCGLEAMKAVTRPLMAAIRPAPATNSAVAVAEAPPRAPLWQPGVLEDAAIEAGLEPVETFDFSFAYRYGDDAALARALLAPMGLGALIGAELEPQVREQILAAMAPYRSEDGGYRIENEYRCLIASAS